MAQDITCELQLLADYSHKMRYWSHEKLEREDVFASTGPNSSEAEFAWRRAIDLEKTRREER